MGNNIEDALRIGVVEKESVTLRLPKSLIESVTALQVSLKEKKMFVTKSKLYEVLLTEALAIRE